MGRVGRVRSVPVAIVAGAAGLCALLVLATPWGLPEWVFLTALSATFGLALRAVWSVARSARSTTHTARRLTGLDPQTLAEDAVREERRRLSEDITATLRSALTLIDDTAAQVTPAQDPRPALQRIHRQTAVASTELRRQLGLLRTPPQPVRTAHHPAARSPAWPPRADLILACLATVLAGVEAICYPLAEHLSVSGWTVMLSVLVAGTVVGRTRAPAVAALGAAGLFILGVLSSAPVAPGFWCLVSPCVLIWTLMARTPGSPSALLLALAAGWSSWSDNPENAPVMIVIVTTAAIGGLVAGRSRRVEAAAGAIVRRRSSELDAARRAAIDAERITFARELHDTVSHAVGVIAVQAGAAQVSWPHDRQAVASALAVIETTARGALAELGRWPAQTHRRGIEDIHRLTDRIRAGGTPVEVSVTGDLPTAATDLVYRVVQESLTNVIRHGAGASARVSLRCAEQVRVEVSDDGPGPGADDLRGYGLVGLTERVRQVGGSLRAGPGADGRGFAVDVLLPGDPPGGGRG